METLKKPRNKARIGIVVLVLLMITIVAAIQFSNKPQPAALGAQEQAESTATLEASDPNVALPAFPTPEYNLLGGITRLTSLDTTIPKRPTVDVTTYEVQPGDNLFLIADKYGLDPETILWGNYEVLRDNPQFLSPGQVLNILPTNGVYYQWTEGDNLNSIASFFKVDPEAILDYPGNRLLPDLASPTTPEIEPGTWVIIPGGKRVLKDWGPPAITRANPAAAAYYGEGYCGQIYEGAIGVGSFIWPTVATYLSGYDYSPPLHNGIDIAGAEGNAIFATDSGVVVFAGWSQYGYGYLIVLDHGNGWQSAYAHLSAVGVTCGQSVAQGTMIGGLGTTGNSTGPHLHFELRNDAYGKVNPWDFLIR
jgi:murein DD-endopeptidase MepM/ murein hydrolase activator NlpD